MKKILTPLVIIVFVFTTTGILFSGQAQEDSKFEKILESYFDEMWKFYPTSGTMVGYHKYDNKLENFSSKNIEKHHELLDKFNQEIVAKIDKFKLSPELQLDHEMIVDSIEMELLKHENLIPWEYNPVYYNEIIINSIQCLLEKSYLSLDVRVKNVTERLKELPKFLKQAKENMKTPPLIFTKTALEQFPGILNFYKAELPGVLKQASPALQAKAQAAAAKVIPALENYQNFLNNELLPRSTGNFRLGEQIHRQLVRLTFKNYLPLPELIARAKADYNNIRREMFLVCIPFYKIMYPHINIDQLGTKLSQEQVWNTVIKGVLEKIKGDSITREDFIDKIKTTADEIKKFIQKNQLFELPDENLNIKPMSGSSKGITWTIMHTPGAYETSGEYTVEIETIPEDWEKEQIDSFLKEYNNLLLYFWTVRKVYPGKFVPYVFTKKYPSLVRNLYPSMPLIEGWPVYVEEMLVYSGFGNYDLRMRLNQLKLYLRAVIDLLLEFNIQEGSMTKEQAINYMMRGGFQTREEAERKWVNACLQPGEIAYAYVGIQEILEMEKEYRRRKGNAFSKKEFLKELLSHGALPIRYLREKILQQ